MKAAVVTRYGGPEVIAFRDVPVPATGSNEVLVQVHAATVTSADSRVRGARFPAGFRLLARLFFGIGGPRQPILGTELAGVVAAVGEGVTRFRTGDRVFAFSGAGMGCHAAFKVMVEDGPIAAIPVGFSFDEASAISFGGTTALYFLRDVGRVKPGERVLINGASGAVGSAAVQLAHHFGAHVTGVCSAGNADLVRSLGADAVIDYASEDFATGGDRWDIILDTVGNAPFARCRNALKPNGRLLFVIGGLGDMLMAPLHSMVSGFKVASGVAPERLQDVEALKQLCEEGVYRPVVGKSFAFDRIHEAYGHVDTGHKVGNVVLTFADEVSAFSG